MSKRQRIVINFGDSAALTARVEDRIGQAVTAEEVDRICLSLINHDEEVTIYEACGSNNSEDIDDDLLPSNCFFEQLQTDDTWTEDEQGYSWEHEIDSVYFTQSNVWYIARYTFFFVNGRTKTAEWDIYVRDQATD